MCCIFRLTLSPSLSLILLERTFPSVRFLVSSFIFSLGLKYYCGYPLFHFRQISLINFINLINLINLFTMKFTLILAIAGAALAGKSQHQTQPSPI